MKSTEETGSPVGRELLSWEEMEKRNSFLNKNYLAHVVPVDQVGRDFETNQLTYRARGILNIFYSSN